VPAFYGLEFPIHSAQPGTTAEYVESPFTQTIALSSVPAEHGLDVGLTQRLAYKYIEGYGLILQGHVTFYDQHFIRTVPLPYLLNSSSSFLGEIVRNIQRVILDNNIDCILYPEQSSISALVDRVLTVPEISKRHVRTIICRSAAWADGSAGYQLDIVGKERLAESENVLILEDETYTGNSIKTLATLCFEVLGRRLKRLAVYVVIDSMVHTERVVISRLLREASANPDPDYPNDATTRPDIRLYAFMHFSVSPYWNESTCPMCRTIRSLRQLSEQRAGPIERRYTSNRMAALQPKSMDQDLSARGRLQSLPEVIELRRSELIGEVAVSTREGLEMFCEEAYVEGDIGWLLRHINPQHPDSLADLDVILQIVAMLARDFRLLRRVGLADEFLSHVNAMLARGMFRGKRLGLLMESASGWPLHCLQAIWDNLLAAVFVQSSDDFVDCYGGARLLLADVGQRYEHPIRSALFAVFDNQVLKLHNGVTPSDRARRITVHMALCLWRSIHPLTQQNRTVGELISGLSFLLGFFAPDKADHRILSRGLDDFILCAILPDARRYIYVVQMAEHIRADLVSLEQLAPTGSDRMIAAPDYRLLLGAITELQTTYPNLEGRDMDEKELRSAQESAARIRKVLYADESEGGLNSVLRSFLNQYRCSPREALNSILDWVQRDTGVSLNTSLSDADLDNENLQVVLNDEALHEIFDALATNIVEAKVRRDKTFKCQRPDTDLFGAPPTFWISIQHDITIERLVLTILNPCTREEYQTLQSATGEGIRGLKSAATWLGHDYDTRWQEQTEDLQQTISLRRIHR
jgi:hypothetical protein